MAFSCEGELAGVKVHWERMLADARVTNTTGTAGWMANGGVPLAITNPRGKGRAMFLNLSLAKILANYSSDAATRSALLGLLEQGGIYTKVKVPAGYWVTRFQGDGYELLGCRITADGREGEPVGLGQVCHVYDVRGGKYLGAVDQVVPSACQGRNNLFALLPMPACDFSLAFPKKIAPGDIVDAVVTPKPAAGRCAPARLFRARVLDAAGREVEAMRQFGDGRDKAITLDLPFAWNQAPGSYTLEVSDILTGMKQAQAFVVK